MASLKNDNSPEKTVKGHHLSLILLMIFALLLVIFAIQNSHDVVIRLWFWRFETSMALALVISIIAGFLLCSLYTLPLLQSKNKIIRSKNKEIEKIKAEKNYF